MPDKESLNANTGRKVVDDEQLKKMLSANKVGFLKRNQYQIVTLSLIAINLIVFVIEFILSGFSINIDGMVLLTMGAMYTPAIQSLADLYRFVTPMFLHMDFMHIAFNMVALYSVGGVLERVLGKGNFLLLYFVAGITGNASTYITDVFITGVPTLSAGASTSVFGLFIAMALLGVLHKGNRSYFAQFSRGMLAIIGINIVYTLLMPGISISGHLGGAIGGLIAMFMVPSKSLRVPTVVRVIVAVLWVAALVYLFIQQGFFTL